MGNVLILTNAYPSSEKKYAGVFVKNQVDWLSDNTDLDVEVLAIKRSFTSAFGSVKKYLTIYLRFLAYLKNKYDVLHIHFLSPLLILPCLYKIFYPSSRVILTLHGSDINNLENKFLLKVYRVLIRSVDKIICVGQSMETVVKSKLDRDVDHFLCAGINTSAIQRQDKSYSDRDIDFLYVGSFYKVKGFDRLIEALDMIKNEGFKAVLIGSGNYKNELEDLANRIDLTVIHGLEQKEVSKYYNESRFFVFPSRSEGFGLSLAEAMYCGTPAVISDLDQLKYQVRDGWNGFICQDTTPARLAEILKEANRISPEKWATLSAHARKSAEKYTIDDVCRSLTDIYLESDLN